MEKEVVDLLSDEVKQEAASKYGAEIADLKLLGDFENFAYECVKADRSFIIRITHSSHRT